MITATVLSLASLQCTLSSDRRSPRRAAANATLDRRNASSCYRSARKPAETEGLTQRNTRLPASLLIALSLTWEWRAEDFSRFSVTGFEYMGVDPQGRAGVGVTESTRDRADVGTGSNQ
jgi:hypothetical protein